MLKLHRIWKLLVCIGLIAAFLGCESKKKQESTSQYIDDSVITNKVRTAIFNEATLKTLQINVNTFKGVVQLSGFVDSEQSVTKAGEVAGRVEGVKEVKNELLVDDSGITNKVKDAIFNEATLKTLQINVNTYKGVVQLSGFVDSAQSVTKAGEVARRVEGVKEVKNELLVDDSGITNKVKAAIFDEPSLKTSQINVNTYNGVVTISGFVDSEQNVTKAGEIAGRVDGVKEVKNYLIIR